MAIVRVVIEGDAKTVYFHPSPDRVTWPEDEGHPLLKRLAPKRPQPKPKSPKKDD